MGYESKLYIVNKTGIKDPDINMFWGEVIATFDLCKVSPVENRIAKYPPTNTYIYNDAGERILEDCYGETLVEIPIEDMIRILEEVDDNCYRRYKPCIALLKSFNPKQWDELVVLRYGY